MANPPTLPPSALAGAQAKVRIDQIAVRLIHIPDEARGASGPTRLSGTVSGQNEDGSLTVRTDKGDVRILLKDRANLPQGAQIEIEIPAGRSPQTARIDLVRAENTPPPARRGAEGGDGQSRSYPTSSVTPNALEPKAQLNTDTLRSVITSNQTATPESPIPVAGGNLQAGQIARLIPIPPGSLPPEVQKLLSTPLPLPDVVEGLVRIIEGLPSSLSTPINPTRLALIAILARLDTSTLLSGGKPSSSGTTAEQLAGRIQTLLQSVELPNNLSSDTKGPNSLASATPPQPQGLTLFNPSKPVDGQILAFQGTSPLGQNLVVQQTLTPQSLQGAQLSPAQVIGFTDGKLPILSLPLPQTGGMSQLYTLQFRAENLATGTPVFIALDPLSTRPAQTLFTQLPDGTLTLAPGTLPAAIHQWAKSDTWDSLDTLFKTLMHLAPEQAGGFAQMIPSAARPEMMHPLHLFFLSLLRSGGGDAIENLIPGEAAALLRQMGKVDLLRSVAGDMTLAGKIDSLAAGGMGLLPQDWRMTFLPLLWEQNLHRIPLYYRKWDEDSDTTDQQDRDRKRRKLRFLFDLKLSRMGGVQVDGFMQPERLDIILRTKSPLSPPMQSRMKQLYAGTMEKSRLTGDLSFQFKPEHWVDFAQNPSKTGVTA